MRVVWSSCCPPARVRSGALPTPQDSPSPAGTVRPGRAPALPGAVQPHPEAGGRGGVGGLDTCRARHGGVDLDEQLVRWSQPGGLRRVGVILQREGVAPPLRQPAVLEALNVLAVQGMDEPSSGQSGEQGPCRNFRGAPGHPRPCIRPASRPSSPGCCCTRRRPSRANRSPARTRLGLKHTELCLQSVLALITST